ncbi:MAG TPA: MerR family transcriptional regulator [Alphaproteobacteria bacterium]|jgi:DNA-binding transcriptional MerR regulator|nr:MerR family transcriptional regulator [Alphaproteobacteria bacterium]
MTTAAAESAEVGRRGAKSATAFRTISEVSSELDVPQHVLRFWESKFNQLRPLKRGGGRRYYRPEDIALLRRIRDLLYAEGYTIRGVQKLFREQSVSPAKLARAEDPPAAPSAAPDGAGLDAGKRAELRSVLDELVTLRERLRAASG